MGTRTFLAAVMAVTVVAACDGAGGPPPDEVLTSVVEADTTEPASTTSALSTTQPETLPTVPPQGDVEVIFDLWDWRTVRGPEPLIGPPAAVDGRYLMHAVQDLIVEDLPTRETLLEHARETSDVEWIWQDIRMGGEWVALSEDTVEYPLQYRVTAFNIVTGEKLVVTETDPSLPDRRAVPSLALEGSRLVWTETVLSGSVCVLSMDLDDRGSPEIVTCSDAGGNSGIAGLQLSGDTLSYIHSAYDATDDTSCFELLVFELGSDEPETVGNESCSAFQGASDGDTAVWSEAQPGSSYLYDHLPLFGNHRAVPYDLGSGVGGSVRACGDDIYWIWESSDGSSTQIRTWEPGRPVTVIFEEQRPDWGINGDIDCTATNITFVRSFSGEGPIQGEILTSTLP